MVIWKAWGRRTQFSESKETIRELRCLRIKLNYTSPSFLFSACKWIQMPRLSAVPFYETRAGGARVTREPSESQGPLSAWGLSQLLSSKQRADQEKGSGHTWGCSLRCGEALRKAFCGADELTPALLLFPTILYLHKPADKTAAAALSPLSQNYYFFLIVIIIKDTTRFIFCKTSHVIVKTDLKRWIRKGHYNTFCMKMKYRERFLGRPNVFGAVLWE